MTITNNYHYAESGLDNIWLANGYEFVDLPSGKHLKINDIEGLHREIGRILIESKKDLTGNEIRFLRKEMLLSQASLAKLFEITEQTVYRWEKNKADIPKPAESLIRVLYREHIHDNSGTSIRSKLEKLADLEDAIDGQRMTARRSNNRKWQLQLDLAA
ncbi:MAG: helix-turn-helix domain-containing protein [Pseudomonadota bacterium]|nr:helix-turn-helix domain-containing protein [Pseudomonadota bacterium]